MGKAKKNDVNAKNSVRKLNKNKSRKELRKEKRMEKKERKNQHYQKKFLHLKNEVKDLSVKIEKNSNKMVVNSNQKKFKAHSKKENKKGGIDVNLSPKNFSSFDKQSLNHRNEKMEQINLEKEMKIQRRKQMIIENRNEDKVIKKLEKQLHLNKRKSKTLPQSFMDEGLDYLLDVCDGDKIRNALKAEKSLQDSGSEFEEDFAVITGKKKIIEKHKSEKNSGTSFSEDGSDILDDNSDNEDYEFSNEEENDDDISNNSLENIENEQPLVKKIKVDRNVKVNKNNQYTKRNLEEEEEFEFSGSSEKEDENSVVDDDNDDDDDDGNDDDCDQNSDFNDSSDDNEASEDINDDVAYSKKEVGIYEDIYGRKRDKDGNIICETGKYVPPHLKAQLLGNKGREEQIARLRKQIKGLLNRLAENNMHSIVSQMDQLFMQNSRNDMNDSLTNLTFESLIQPILVPERLIIEHTMLIAALHANVGSEVGAHFLQAVVEKFDSTYRSNMDVSNKELDNICLIVAHLYSFKVFNNVLMFDILNRLAGAAEFGEKEVELLLIVLRNVGFNLRKDDPVELKNVILKVQSSVNNVVDLSKQSRVRFMLDILSAIKNNNMSKIPHYDPVQIEHHKKVLKNLIQKGKYVSELNITLEDLLKAPEKGRWWVVGSAWSGSNISKTNNVSNSDHVTNDISQTYLDLAKKHRMSTDTRRNIFCIIMSAEDYMDAFEKLLRLGLKGPQEQTIIHVIVHCLFQEKTFNPYYAYLASQFCTADRRHLMTLQYHLWDRIRELNDSKGFQITNLALFLSHLILEKSLPLSVLKVIEFASLSKPHVRLLRRILLTLLLHKSDETVAEVFHRISRAPKLKLFRESIRLFFHHLILKNISEDSSQMAKLKERVKLAESCMNFVT